MIMNTRKIIHLILIILLKMISKMQPLSLPQGGFGTERITISARPVRLHTRRDFLKMDSPCQKDIQ